MVFSGLCVYYLGYSPYPKMLAKKIWDLNPGLVAPDL